MENSNEEENKKHGLTYKVYMKRKIKNNEKDVVVFKGDDLEKFNGYNELKTELIRNVQKGEYKEKFRSNEKLVFNLREEITSLIPLKTVYSKESFEYLIEKLKARNFNKIIYLDAVKVEKFPTWHRPKLEEILKDSLEESINEVKKTLKEQLDLKKLEDTNLCLRNNNKEIKDLENKNRADHKGILCNNCLEENIKGKRFVCSECYNYNLCEKCEKILRSGDIHPKEHNMILIKDPINLDISAYSNIISPNEILLKNMPDTFEIELNVLNNGEKNLKNCYILSTRYNTEFNTFLIGKPTLIEEEFGNNETLKINLAITIPNELMDVNSEGYFRFFTSNGIPFGDLIKVKVYNEMVKC